MTSEPEDKPEQTPDVRPELALKRDLTPGRGMKPKLGLVPTVNLRSFLGTLLTVAISFGAGVTTALYFAPDLLQRMSGEALPEAMSARLLAAGDMRGVGSTVRARGRVQLLAGDDLQLLRLTGFEVTPGPDLEVWLLAGAPVADSGDVAARDVLSLGPLKGFAGDQAYVIPEGVDPGGYGQVAIWSASARRLFAVAALEAGGNGATGQVSDG